MNTFKSLSMLGMSAALVAFAGASLVANADHHDERPSAPRVAEVGQPAPDFELTDIDGNKHKLSNYKGKIVVLEWWNPECPAVVYHYRDNERALLRNWANSVHKNDDHVWLTINSGAPGLQGAGLEKSKHYKKEYNMEVPILLDKEGDVGRMYRARRTPEMYVIDKEGVLRYHGALDNAPWGREPEGEHINYVAHAITQIKAGETVTPSRTESYGCTVKYAPGRGIDSEVRSRGGERGAERSGERRGERGSERGRRGERDRRRDGR